MVLVNPKFEELKAVIKDCTVRAVVMGAVIGVANSMQHIHADIADTLKAKGFPIAEPYFELMIDRIYGEARIDVTSYHPYGESINWRAVCNNAQRQVIEDIASQLNQEL